MVPDGKSSQEYLVNAEVPQGSILGPTLFPPYNNELPDGVICHIAICADDTTLDSKCVQAFDLWQQLEFVSELESDLRDTVNWFHYWSKTTSKKIGGLISSMKFFSPEAALYLYKSIVRPCMKYCCHVWAGAPS